MAELKPCPFCGSKGKIRECVGEWIVECENTSCPISYPIGAFFETEEAAVEWWNRRADHV